MKSPDCIQYVCRDYRKLFSSDEAMAEALSIDVRIAQDLVSGDAYPAIDVMIQVQDALRKASAARPVRD